MMSRMCTSSAAAAATGSTIRHRRQTSRPWLGYLACLQGKALLKSYSSCAQEGKALLMLPSTAGKAGKVGYGRRAVPCGWRTMPGAGHGGWWPRRGESP
jgi:hypothetical protein